MILVDSSVWIDALRGGRTPATARLRELLGGDLITTDAVVMEVLAGARPGHVDRHERLLAMCQRIASEPHDFDQAAAIYRACRQRGITPRSLVDCLIAAVARRVDAAVLHRDRDFDAIAEVVDLHVER